MFGAVSPRAPMPCRGAERRPRAVGRDARCTPIEAAFLATKKPVRRALVRPQIDRAPRRLRARVERRGHRELRGDTRAREQSEEILTLRQVCLDRRLEATARAGPGAAPAPTPRHGIGARGETAPNITAPAHAIAISATASAPRRHRRGPACRPARPTVRVGGSFASSAATARASQRGVSGRTPAHVGCGHREVTRREPRSR